MALNNLKKKSPTKFTFTDTPSWTVQPDMDMEGGYIIREVTRRQRDWVANGFDESDEEGDRRGTIVEAEEKGNAHLIGMAPALLRNMKDMSEKYGALHDILSDMIESGRLSQYDIPDDHQALVEALAACLRPATQAEEMVQQFVFKEDASSDKQKKLPFSPAPESNQSASDPFSYSETATILASLRLMQEEIETNGVDAVENRFPHFLDAKCLSSEEIDGLAEEFNDGLSGSIKIMPARLRNQSPSI